MPSRCRRRVLVALGIAAGSLADIDDGILTHDRSEADNGGEKFEWNGLRARLLLSQFLPALGEEILLLCGLDACLLEDPELDTLDIERLLLPAFFFGPRKAGGSEFDGFDSSDFWIFDCRCLA